MAIDIIIYFPPRACNMMLLELMAIGWVRLNAGHLSLPYPIYLYLFPSSLEKEKGYK